MKILLLGEFSALHKNLKDGLVDLGHDVILASDGDGFKNITRDIDLRPKLPSFLGKIEIRIKLLIYLFTKFKNFDVVQLINAFHFHKILFPNRFFIKRLNKSNKKFFLLAAGSDSYFWKFGKSKMKYSPHDDVLKYDLQRNQHPYQRNKMFRFNEFVANIVDGIIPVSYEYKTCYEDHKKLLNFIEMPMNSEEISFFENDVKDKIVIFHGLNRYGFKGTRHIEAAFKILEKKYPQDLELIIDGNMSLDKYMSIMKRSNIVVDQTYGYSQGINGLYALAMGKVVLGGAEPESLKCMNVSSSPVINIKPDANFIVREIENLIHKKDEIRKIGFESRKFVENIHAHEKVAKKFITTWLN